MQEPKTVEEEDFELPDLSHFRVLVVDDNPELREIVCSMLTRLKVSEIMETNTALAALDRLGDFSCDLVIVAMTMRPINGIEFVRRVRTDKNSPNPDVPIIMTSAVTSMKTVIEARDAGIDEFVATPFSFNILCEHIIGVTSNPRPVLKSKAYSGPDRRRRTRNMDGMDRRRNDPEMTERKLGSEED